MKGFKEFLVAAILAVVLFFSYIVFDAYAASNLTVNNLTAQGTASGVTVSGTTVIVGAKLTAPNAAITTLTSTSVNASTIDVNGATKFGGQVRQQRTVYSSAVALTMSGTSVVSNSIFDITGVTSGITVTMDTGTNISAAISGVATGDSAQFVLKNSNSNTINIQGNTGCTLSSAMAVTTLQTRIMTIICTGTNTWIVY